MHCTYHEIAVTQTVRKLYKYIECIQQSGAQSISHQNAHLRALVSVLRNELDVQRDVPSREALAQVLEGGCLDDELVYLRWHRQHFVRVKISACHSSKLAIEDKCREV